jgi:hypothetical protein
MRLKENDREIYGIIFVKPPSFSGKATYLGIS